MTAATISVIKWLGSLQSKDTPYATGAKGSKNRPSKGAISARSKTGKVVPHSMNSTAGPSNATFTDQQSNALPVEGRRRRCPRLGGLLISGSRVDSTAAQRAPQIKLRRGHLCSASQRPY
jgi:hypothetical protein